MNNTIEQLINAKVVYRTGSVRYGFSRTHRKWEFRFANGRGTYLTHVRGGKSVAEQISAAILASVKRHRGQSIVDGLAHARIATLNPA